MLIYCGLSGLAAFAGRGRPSRAAQVVNLGLAGFGLVDCFAIMGGFDIFVPADARIECDAISVMGGIKTTRPRPA